MVGGRFVKSLYQLKSFLLRKHVAVNADRVRFKGPMPKWPVQETNTA